MTNYEVAFWNDCTDTFNEERKHFTYARLMGIDFNLQGKDVVDIGGGPVSMLLKCRNRGACTVIDPILDKGKLPAWVHARYKEAGIHVQSLPGEYIEIDDAAPWDEAWIYNVLQHVDDPKLVIYNARACAKTLRIFEWVGIPAYEGHPHELSVEKLEEWLGGRGDVTGLAEDGCHGTAFSGVFT